MAAELQSILPSDVQRPIAALSLFLIASLANADDALHVSGFALVRGSSKVSEGPLDHDPISAQLQLGIDWSSSPALLAHVHLIGRNENDAVRGNAGIAEAYVELNLHPANQRLRLRGGALFLPSSRENVDALWENPYAISSSALNTWLGEEFRPIGIDAAWIGRGPFAGATVFRGNDTLGAIPAGPGWAINDDWALLGEWYPVGFGYYTSVSAENDHHLGWSARAGWSADRLFVQGTHIDNRGDALPHGRLFDWNTRFDIVSAEYTANDWTVAGESGWGPTYLIIDKKYVTDLRATYLLVSRRLSKARLTVRVDHFDAVTRGHALTAAAFWNPLPKVRLGTELTKANGSRRALVEVRYHFSAH